MEGMKLFDVLSAVDEEFILSAGEFLGYINRDRQQKGRGIRKISRTLLLAAVIASFLIVTAVAVGISIHQRRQQELRERLQVEENHISSYVEHEEQAGEISLLSNINDGKFQNLFINISPVPEEYIDALVGMGEKPVEFYYEINRLGYGGSALPDVYTNGEKPPTEKVYDEESGESYYIQDSQWRKDLIMDTAYDAETQTLTVKCSILLDYGDVDWSKPVEIRVMAMEVTPIPGMASNVEVLHDYGSILLQPSQAQELDIVFEQPYIFKNEETGVDCRLVGFRISPLGMSFNVSHEDADIIYNLPSKDEDEAAFRAAFELQLKWLRFYDELMGSSVLRFTDGTEEKILPPLSGPYEDGVARMYTEFTKTIDVSAIESITVMGENIPLR